MGSRIFRGINRGVASFISALEKLGLIEQRNEIEDVLDFIRYGTTSSAEKVRIVRDPNTMAEATFGGVKVCKSRNEGFIWVLSKKSHKSFVLHRCRINLDNRWSSSEEFTIAPRDVHKNFGMLLN